MTTCVIPPCVHKCKVTHISSRRAPPAIGTCELLVSLTPVFFQSSTNDADGAHFSHVHFAVTPTTFSECLFSSSGRRMTQLDSASQFRRNSLGRDAEECEDDRESLLGQPGTNMCVGTSGRVAVVQQQSTRLLLKSKLLLLYIWFQNEKKKGNRNKSKCFHVFFFCCLSTHQKQIPESECQKKPHTFHCMIRYK